MKILPALIPLSLFGCLPNLLVPHDYTVEKNNDEAYIDVDSITLSLRNLEIKQDHYVFGMEIQNNSNKPVFIDPDKIQKYAHYFSYREDEKEKHLQEVMSAMSPTQVNRFFEAKSRDARAAGFFLFLVGAAITTYDAIKDEQDYSKESWTRKDEKKSRSRDIITSASLLATGVLTEAAHTGGDKAEAELRFLPDELFTRKMIHPGERYFGKILFRKTDEVHKYHRVICPVEDKQFLFDFRRATMEERRFLFEQRN